MSAFPPSRYVGFCYCQAVHFSVDHDVEPYKAAYCHCESCRRAHSSPLYQIVYIPRAKFLITQGEEHVKYFCKDGSLVTRSFCGMCGSKISNDLSHRPDYKGFFPALLEEDIQHKLPKIFQPTFHFNAHESVLDMENVFVDCLEKNIKPDTYIETWLPSMTPTEWLNSNGEDIPGKSRKGLCYRIMSGRSTDEWDKLLGSKQLVFVGGPEHLERLRVTSTGEALKLVGWPEEDIEKEKANNAPYRVVVFANEDAAQGKAATLDLVLDELLPRVHDTDDMSLDIYSTGKRPWSKNKHNNLLFVERMKKEDRDAWFTKEKPDKTLKPEGGVDEYLNGKRGPRQLLRDLFYCEDEWSGDGWCTFKGERTGAREYLVEREVKTEHVFFDLEW
jgi:hypothetical protein